LTYIRQSFAPKFFSRFVSHNSDYDLRAKSNVRVPNRQTRHHGVSSARDSSELSLSLYLANRLPFSSPLWDQVQLLAWPLHCAFQNPLEGEKQWLQHQ